MKKVRFVGLDVHADTIAVAVAEPGGTVRSVGVIPNRPESIRRLAHHVSQCLVRGVGDPHRRQVARAVAARQLQSIAPIRLHAIAGFHRHQGGRDHLAPHAERGQLPIEDIPRGARLVTHAQLLG